MTIFYIILFTGLGIMVIASFLARIDISANNKDKPFAVYFLMGIFMLKYLFGPAKKYKYRKIVRILMPIGLIISIIGLIIIFKLDGFR